MGISNPNVSSQNVKRFQTKHLHFVKHIKCKLKILSALRHLSQITKGEQRRGGRRGRERGGERERHALAY